MSSPKFDFSMPQWKRDAMPAVERWLLDQPPADMAELRPRVGYVGSAAVQTMSWCVFGQPVGLYDLEVGVTDFSSIARPWDAQDFEQCVKFMETFVPEAYRENTLAQVGSLCPEWRAIVDEWDEFSMLHRQGRGDKITERLGLLVQGNLPGDTPVDLVSNADLIEELQRRGLVVCAWSADDLAAFLFNDREVPEEDQGAAADVIFAAMKAGGLQEAIYRAASGAIEDSYGDHVEAALASYEQPSAPGMKG